MTTWTKVLAADAARDQVSWQPMPTSGDLTAEYILGAADATLPNSLVLTAGSGITLTPGGGLMTVAATAAPPNLFPYVDTLGTVYIGAATSNGPGFSLTMAGVAFTPWVAGSVITGMRFVWVRPPAAPDVLCNLWVGSSSVASVTVTNPATGIVHATFSSPYTVLTSDLGGTAMVLSMFAPNGTGAYYTEVDFTDLIVPALPVMASPLWRYIANQGGGGPTNTQTYAQVFGLTGLATNSTTPARPSSSSTNYVAIEPVFA